jgi:hypothetical protein
MVRSEGNVSLKNPVTPPGINPGTVRLLAQRLNHYATLRPTTKTPDSNLGALTFLLDCILHEGGMAT